MKTLSLTVDYSNGAQKMFAGVPWSEGLLIIEAMKAAGGIAPGLAVEHGFSRSGSVINLTIDGLPGDGSDDEWMVWVNAKPAPRSLATDTSIGFHPETREPNEVHSGDHIVCKLVTPPADE